MTTLACLPPERFLMPAKLERPGHDQTTLPCGMFLASRLRSTLSRFNLQRATVVVKATSLPSFPLCSGRRAISAEHKRSTGRSSDEAGLCWGDRGDQAVPSGVPAADAAAALSVSHAAPGEAG